MSFSRFQVRVWNEKSDKPEKPEGTGETFLIDGEHTVTGPGEEPLLSVRHKESELRRWSRKFVSEPGSIGSSLTRLQLPGDGVDFVIDLGLMLAALGESIQIARGSNQKGGGGRAVELGMPEDPRGGGK